MAQFHVYRLPGGRLVLDLQTDLMESGTRVVAPLVPATEVPPLGRLHPVLDLGEVPHTLVTTEMAGLPKALLRDVAFDLGARQDDIRRAIDMVFSGF